MIKLAKSAAAAALVGAALGAGYSLAAPDLAGAPAADKPMSRMGALAGSPLAICRGGVPRGARDRLAALQKYADDHRAEWHLADNPLGSDDPDLDLMEKLGLLEGHLIIGKMLVDAKKVSDGLPHFGHPVRELYDYIKPVIERKKLRAYDADLKALENEVRAEGPRVNALYTAAIAWVAEVRASIPAAKRNDGKFILQAVALLLEDAAEDFGESLENGRITNTVEFHDAMGFTIYTKNLVTAYRTQADAFAKSRIDRVMAEIDGAMRAFPSLTPLERPAMSVSQMKGHAARVQDLTK